MFSKAASPDTRLNRYDHFIVHVTATPPSRDLDDTDVDRMHRQRGFNGCGYHAIITRDGRWLDADMGAVTRPIGHQGAHVGNCGPGWNGRSFGVSLVGGVDERLRPQNNATPAQLATLARGIARFVALHPGGEAGVSIMGHRDLIEITGSPAKKACPCFDVIEWWAMEEAGRGVLVDEDQESDGGASPVDRPQIWTVEPGDTLSMIAGVTGLGLGEILRLNADIANVNHIRVGQVIRLA